MTRKAIKIPTPMPYIIIFCCTSLLCMLTKTLLALLVKLLTPLTLDEADSIASLFLDNSSVISNATSSVSAMTRLAFSNVEFWDWSVLVVWRRCSRTAEFFPEPPASISLLPMRRDWRSTSFWTALTSSTKLAWLPFATRTIFWHSALISLPSTLRDSIVICLRRSLACESRAFAWDILDSMDRLEGSLPSLPLIKSRVDRICDCMEENSSLYRENGITVEAIYFNCVLLIRDWLDWWWYVVLQQGGRKLDRSKGFVYSCMNNHCCSFFQTFFSASSYLSSYKVFGIAKEFFGSPFTKGVSTHRRMNLW